MGTSRPETCRG